MIDEFEKALNETEMLFAQNNTERKAKATILINKVLSLIDYNDAVELLEDCQHELFAKAEMATAHSTWGSLQ